MLHHRTLLKSGLAVSMSMLLLVGAGSLSYGVTGCQATTPCPCAADGVCRPKRDSWGVYETKWRTWPGEQVDQAPTEADSKVDGDENTPQPYELPTPEQEELRGPAKKNRDKEPEEADGAELPAELPGELPGQLLPGPDAAPEDFDPFGMDDAPPALPASLRQAAAAMQMPVDASRLTSGHQPTTRLPSVNTTTAQQPVRQVNWHEQSNSIQLINPASAIVADPTASGLQQAVYYEASDQ